MELCVLHSIKLS